MDAERTLENVRFRTDVSVRYHDRRRGFFKFIRRVVELVSVLAGSAAIAGFSTLLEHAQTGQWLILSSTLLVTLLNGLSLVWGIADRAAEHDVLYRRYIECERRIVLQGDLSDASVRALEAQVLEIELEEGPIYWGVYAACWNQAIDFLQRPQAYARRIPWWTGLLSNFFRLSERSFPTVGEQRL